MSWVNRTTRHVQYGIEKKEKQESSTIHLERLEVVFLRLMWRRRLNAAKRLGIRVSIHSTTTDTRKFGLFCLKIIVRRRLCQILRTNLILIESSISLRFTGSERHTDNSFRCRNDRRPPRSQWTTSLHFATPGPASITTQAFGGFWVPDGLRRTVVWRWASIEQKKWKSSEEVFKGRWR